jgi:hypothetical protein
MEDTEVWRQIEGYDKYEVSSLGNVRNSKTGRILKQGKKGGYCMVGLSSKLTKSYSVHQLVAKAFIPNPENKPQVNHLDKNGLNNQISNLEWVTNKENSIHRSYGVKQTTNQNLEIYKIDKDTDEIVDKFSSIELASKSILLENSTLIFNTVRGGISMAINGNQITSYGYKWKKIEQPSLENEEWREINIDGKNTKGYFISSLGRFKNSKNVIMSNYKPHHSGYIYVRVNIDKYALHRLVALTFIPNLDNKPFVNHIDGNKINNSLSNLEWVTCAENNQHNHNIGLIKCYKRKVAQYDLDMNEINRFESIKEAADFVKISSSIIKRVLYKKQNLGGGFIWKYLD